jgi:hypothetical protein
MIVNGKISLNQKEVFFAVCIYMNVRGKIMCASVMLKQAEKEREKIIKHIKTANIEI